MARSGLGPDWECLFANDLDPKKASSYSLNWGDEHLKVGDVSELKTNDLPGTPDLAWASFPCQDLSLAGNGAGLKGERSGTFWPFWKLMTSLSEEGRAPHLIALENVCGALSSHGGKDFATICSALARGGYRVGALVINASHFVPQSRPRLFIIAAKKSAISVPDSLLCSEPELVWHSPALVEAYNKLPKTTKKSWVWWNIPTATERTAVFADLVEDKPHGVKWHTVTETKRLLELMTAVNLDKVKAAKKTGRRMVGTIYRRTRTDSKTGEKMQRAEIRFDDIAGCLRTPSGGSSRQTIMLVEGNRVRSRLLSPREAARLMGLPDTYKLPENYNQAYHLAGDGVAVPVVRYLANHLLEPLLLANRNQEKKAAA